MRKWLFPQRSARIQLAAVIRTVLVGAAVTLAACNDVPTDPQLEGVTIPEAAPDLGLTAAATSFNFCFPLYDANGNIVDFTCIRIPLEYNPCYVCPGAIGFEHVILPGDPFYVEDLAVGLELLGQAAANPLEAERLRARAEAAFLSSARRLGRGEIRLGEVGTADLLRNAIEPMPLPWLVAAGGDLVDGLTLMKRALGEPVPLPWRRAAMAKFERAYQQISQQGRLGG